MKPATDGVGHEAPRCEAKTRAGGTCKNAAGFKTGHPGVGRCAFHGGATPTHERGATTEMARRECARLGIPIETDPGDALLHAVWECSGNVAFYRSQVQQLPTEPEPDQYIECANGKGRWKRGEPGVWGHTYHVSGVPTGEAKPHVWVDLYNRERDRLVDVCVAARRAGVEDRRVRLAEENGRVLAEVIRGVLREVGVLDQPDIGSIVRHHLTLAAEGHYTNGRACTGS